MEENLINLSEDEMQGRTGHSGKGELYGKYKSAIRPKILSWLNEQLKTNERIRIKNKGIAKELGIGFANKSPTTIYWALKYVLFYENIIVATATHKDGSEVLTFRKRVKSDVLPDSLRRKELQYERQQEIGKVPEDEDEDEDEVIKEAEFTEIPVNEAESPVEKRAELTTIELEQQQRAQKTEAKEPEVKETVSEAKEPEVKETKRRKRKNE